jgi:Tetraacyldisaccharide-1-P 4'-kinase
MMRSRCRRLSSLTLIVVGRKDPLTPPSPQGERERWSEPYPPRGKNARHRLRGNRARQRPFSPSRFLGNAITLSGKHAKACLLGEGQDEGVSIPASAGTLARRLSIYEADIVPIATDELLNRQFLAFCGIGRPAKFFDTLRLAGVAILKCRSFPDHHPYSEADAMSLIAEAKTLKAGLLTTEKDHVRLKGKEGNLGELYRSAASLPITVQFSGDDEALLMRSIVTAIDEQSTR